MCSGWKPPGAHPHKCPTPHVQPCSSYGFSCLPAPWLTSYAILPPTHPPDKTTNKCSRALHVDLPARLWRRLLRACHRAGAPVVCAVSSVSLLAGTAATNQYCPVPRCHIPPPLFSHTRRPPSLWRAVCTALLCRRERNGVLHRVVTYLHSSDVLLCCFPVLQ